MTKKSEHRTRVNLIQKELENSVAHKLTLCNTVEEKRALVVSQNPLHYVFGEELRVWKGYLTYEENMADFIWIG